MNARIDDLIALAALGELTDAEAIELDMAASGDERVAEELAEALATASALQASARQAPPESLRSSVLDAIATLQQEPPPAPRATLVSGSDGPALLPPPVGPVVTSIAHERRRRLAPILAAAAALLVVVGGAVVVTSNDSGTDDPVAAVVDAGDASARRLDGELGESLTVVYSPSAGALVVTGDGVPVTPDDETYQLWLIDSSGARSVGVFRPDDSGRVSVRFDEADPSGLVLGVTREPAGGSESPTLPILASA